MVVGRGRNLPISKKKPSCFLLRGWCKVEHWDIHKYYWVNLDIPKCYVAELIYWWNSLTYPWMSWSAQGASGIWNKGVEIKEFYSKGEIKEFYSKGLAKSSNSFKSWKICSHPAYFVTNIFILYNCATKVRESHIQVCWNLKVYLSSPWSYMLTPS